ncbi:MAG TPA: TSCPD domain-containing protein [Firmicutes bacterium]|nr:TSCPD domain-containing protein [Bacillota bacterium]
MKTTSHGDKVVDTERLCQAVKNGVRFLDNVIDVTEFPIKEIEQMTRYTRPIGLGVMGFADMVVMLDVPYDSDRALDIAEDVMGLITATAWAASEELARERGPFPAWDKSIFRDRPVKARNCSVTTVAPTGTLSMIADCSGGIEPIFAVAYTKTVLDGTPFRYISRYFEQIAKERGFWSEELADEVARTGSVQRIKEVPEDVKALFRTAQEISPERHVKMQAAFQKYVTSSISKTINMPASATKEDVAKMYMLAWKLGCKGITVYRDGCRGTQVLTTGAKAQSGDKARGNVLQEPPTGCSVYTRPRARITSGTTEKVKIGCGSLFVTVNGDEHGLCEVFTATGKYGGCGSQSQATSRLISLALHSGIAPEAVVEEFKDIRCPACLANKDVKVKSCPDAIARALAREIAAYGMRELVSKGRAPWVAPSVQSGGPVCPECGKPLRAESGCQVCPECGYSRCS